MMRSKPLWMARTIPFIGIVLHMAGLVLWWTAPDLPAGPGLILAAWATFTLYSLAMWALGDFIQQALNMKPWGSRDELQKEKSRRAMTLTYFIMLFTLSMILGAYLDDYINPDATSAAQDDETGRILFSLIGFVCFLGAALPTGLLAWMLSPLKGEEAGERCP